MDCNDGILPSCFSSSLCLKSERRCHWRKSGICTSGYACRTSLALVMHLHPLTQRTSGHYHTTVTIQNILFGTTCVCMLYATFIHKVDCNMILPSCVSSFLCHTLILRSESSHWRKSGICTSGYACVTSLALVMHLHLLTQKTPGHSHIVYHHGIIYISIYICIDYMQVIEVIF